MQTAKRSDTTESDRDCPRHAGQDPAVEQNQTAADLPNIDQLIGACIPLAAPTEPEVTDVTPASTTGDLIGQHQRILTWMFGQPPLGLFVERDDE